MGRYYHSFCLHFQDNLIFFTSSLVPLQILSWFSSFFFLFFSSIYFLLLLRSPLLFPSFFSYPLQFIPFSLHGGTFNLINSIDINWKFMKISVLYTTPPPPKVILNLSMDRKDPCLLLNNLDISILGKIFLFLFLFGFLY